jgi:formylglycine-generating enzyme required for sulfatase activity
VRRFALVLAFAVIAFALARAEAPRLQPYTETIPGTPVRFEMVPVPFRGDAPGFWIGAHEVTRAEFDQFRAAVGDPEPGGVGDGRRNSEPVLSVPHALAVEYARWLARVTGRPYQLPSEVEWEQACRAGEEEERPLDERAWYSANAASRPHPVGTRGADRLGLFDMLGNVSEWTGDGASGAREQPAVVKGGSWADAADAVSCGARREPAPWDVATASRVGFRVMRGYDRSAAAAPVVPQEPAGAER